MEPEWVDMLTQLPADEATSKEWVERWLHARPLAPLRTVGTLLQRHDLMSIDVCANILTTLLRDGRASELLTEADVEAAVTARPRDTRYTLLMHTLLHRVAAIIENATDFRSHIVQMVDPELLVLAHFMPSLITGGALDADMGLGAPDLFVLLSAQAWRHLDGNRSEAYWRSTCRVTMAAADSALRQIRTENDMHGYASNSFPVSQIAMLLGRPEDHPGVATAIELCHSGPVILVADFAWHFCGAEHIRATAALVLRGGIPVHRYRKQPVRALVFVALERVQEHWREVFDRPESVESVALQMLIDIDPGDPSDSDTPPSHRLLRCALRLLGMLGARHPGRPVFEPVFWTLSGLLGLLPRCELEAVGGACTRGNHALLRVMLSHCSPDQQRRWRQLCSYPAGPTDAPPAAGVDSLTDMPCRRLYRFHDDANSLPVSLETITRHLLTADPLLDPHTRVPVSRETVVEIGEKIEGCVDG